MRTSALLVLLLLTVSVRSTLHKQYENTGCYFLAFVAFHGASFLPCAPEGTLLKTIGNHDAAFAWMRAHTPLYHGTINGNFKSEDINAGSFYSLSADYAKLHGLGHSYFPTSISPAAYAKTGAPYDHPKVAVYEVADSNSATPDYLLLEALQIEKLVKRMATAGDGAWHKTWLAEYTAQQNKDPGPSKKKVINNVAAVRAMAAKWSTQVPHVPLKGVIQNRMLPQRDVTTLMAGWMGRKANLGVLQVTGMGDTEPQVVKEYLLQSAAFKDLADLCGKAEETRDIDTPLYDEVAMFGKPHSHVRDDALADPSAKGNEDAIMTHLQHWFQSCGTPAFTHPPYSIDYRTWIPGGAELAGPENANVFNSDLTLDLLRAEVDKLVATLEEHVPKGPGRDAVPKFKSLLQASSAGLMTGNQLSELRVHAYLMLRAFCDDWDAWMAVQPNHINNGENNMQDRVCKRAYLSLNDPVVPLSHHHFFHSHGLRDNSDDKQGLRTCKWSWSERKCVPTAQCARQYHLFDFTFSKSCRLRPAV